MSFIFVYTTFGTQENAKVVAKALVEAKLVSCANIFPAIESVYSWEGAVQNDQEIVVIFKTQEALFPSVRDKILELHDYDTPCIVSLPIEKGHQPFLDWIEKETSN